MRTNHKRLFKTLLSALIVTLVSLSAGIALALDSSPPPLANGQGYGVNNWIESGARHGHSQELRSVLQPLRWVKDDNKKFRSKSDVMRQVKKRYKATVLKISLNEQREIYNVRLLMPSGKIRNIQVSARR